MCFVVNTLRFSERFVILEASKNETQMTKQELIELMQSIFKEYNTKYFESKIPTPGFCLFHKKTTLGTYFIKEHKIGLTDYYPNMNRHDVEEIMAHEMVHAYLHVTNNADTGAHYHHGPRFYAMANKVNRLSNGYLHISRCTKLSCPTAPKKRNTDNVVLLVCKDYSAERWCVGRIAETKVKEFLSGWLNKWFKDVEAFEATDGSKFAHLVKSQSRFNYKWYNRQELETKVFPYVRRIAC